MLDQYEKRARAALRYVSQRSQLISEERVNDLDDGFSVERYYVNDTYRDITVVHRNGLAIQCERGVMHHTRDNNQVFRVRTIYKFRRMNVIRPMLEQVRSYARQHGICTEDLELIEKEVREVVGPHNAAKHFSRKIVLERTVTENEIDNNTGCFFPEEDVLVVDSRYADQVFHPHSVRGRAQQSLDPVLEEINGTGVLIEIVDNDNAISSRYIHILGQTVEVRPRRDIERQSGVYVIRAENTAGTDLKSRTTVMTFDEAKEKIGLHRTREEAMSAGDTKMLISERILEAEANLRSIEEKVTQRKHELELLRVDGQHREHHLKSRDREEQAEFSTRKLERDDHYDSRSSSRRDTSESIKLSTVIITAAMTAATALAGWYFANKKQSSSLGITQGLSAAAGIATSVASKVAETVSSVCSSVKSGIGRALSWLF